jgi:hypothetical protein
MLMVTVPATSMLIVAYTGLIMFAHSAVKNSVTSENVHGAMLMSRRAVIKPDSSATISSVMVVSNKEE